MGLNFHRDTSSNNYHTCAVCRKDQSSESIKELTNQKANLSTCHHSSKHSGAVLGGSASGQEAKDGRARASANACREAKQGLVPLD